MLISIPYYTIDASSLTEATMTAGDSLLDFKLNIFIHNSTDFTPALFKALAELKKDFILSLADGLLEKLDPDLNLSEQVYLALSLNPFSKREIVIPILTTRSGMQLAGLTGLREYLQKQGCENVNFPRFNYSKAGSQIRDKCCLVVTDEVSDLSPDHFIEDENRSTMVILTHGRKADLLVINAMQKKIIANQAPSSIDSMKFYVEMNEFELETDLWRNRALLYQDFLMLSKKVQEKEYYDLLNWYKQEYEILPLWYKRFGHILKVLLGKRTFKSLYRDDVKKYKP